MVGNPPSGGARLMPSSPSSTTSHPRTDFQKSATGRGSTASIQMQEMRAAIAEIMPPRDDQLGPVPNATRPRPRSKSWCETGVAWARLETVLARFLPFLVASVLVILIPGPDTLVVLRAALLAGKRTAARTAAGVLTGLSIWVMAAALGVTAILRASHDGYLVLRVAGAVYLTWFGVQALRNRTLGQPIEVSTPKRSIVGRGYRAGLMTDLLNPKVGVFFITFMPAFIPHKAPVAASTFGMGAVFVLLTGAYFVVMLAGVQRLLRWLHDERQRRRLNRATGLVLIGFGVRLAFDG